MSQSSADHDRILVVDDNPGVLKLLGTLFEEQGLSVSLAQSVPEARAALESAGWGFDLVLSDISMPGESGFDLLSWIKREGSPRPDLPVLLTTAHLPEAENRVKGLAMGAVDYVVRPIELSELVLRTMKAIANFKKVRNLEASLQDSENLAIVGRLLAASHHEIRNLAGLVNLASTHIVRLFSGKTDALGTEALRALTQSAELLTDVSRNVSSLLQPEAATARATDVGALVRDVVSLMRERVKPTRLALSGCEGEVWAMAHSVRVKQVLINLILNAKDAIDELDSPIGGAIRIALSHEAEHAAVRVEDDGIGFDPPGERATFQAFATTKKLRGGQGLGLWLCATLAQNMGGRLTLRSSGVGEGAEATLMLVRTSAPTADEFEVARYLAEIEDL